MSYSSANPNLHSPKYATIEAWGAISGISRRVTYELLGQGHLKARKVGARTLIDVDAGLAWIASQPTPQIRPAKTKEAA